MTSLICPASAESRDTNVTGFSAGASGEGERQLTRRGAGRRPRALPVIRPVRRAKHRSERGIDQNDEDKNQNTPYHLVPFLSVFLNVTMHVRISSAWGWFG